MRTLTFPACFGSAAIWGLVAAAGGFCPPAAFGQSLPSPNTAAKTAPLPVLQIEPLTNKGGADARGTDGTPLHSRFVRALAFALKSEEQIAPLPFVVKTRDIAVTVLKPMIPVPLAPKPGKSMSPVPPRPAPSARFRLEGELSVSGPNGPYLCVLRLHDTAEPSMVVAQWAGVAQTLRDLTGNLQRDSRVHALGLAGEFARRVSGTTREMLTPSPVSKEVEEALTRIGGAAASKRLTVERVSEASAKPDTTFRLRVSSQDAGDLYLFTLNEQNQPVAAFEQKSPPVVLPGHPSLLPSTDEPLAFAASGAHRTFLVVLVRRADIATEQEAAQAAAPPAVMVLDGSATRQPVAVDPLFARLMALMQTKGTDDIQSARLIVGAAN